MKRTLSLLRSAAASLTILALVAVAAPHRALASDTPVSSCSDFENIASGLSGSYVLTTDLDCSVDTNAAAIGDFSNPFTGSFDGGGHTITVAININDAFVGLFRYLHGATVQNLRIVGSVQGTTYVGSLSGYVDGATTILRVANSADVTGQEEVGGLVADIASSTISDSYNEGNVTATGSSGSLGGLIAYSNGSNGQSNLLDRFRHREPLQHRRIGRKPAGNPVRQLRRWSDDRKRRRCRRAGRLPERNPGGRLLGYGEDG